MQITSKGRVAMPQEKHNGRGLLPYSQAESTMEGDQAQPCGGPHPAGGKTRGQSVIEALRGAALVPITTDEIMALTRGQHE